jgi:hypothetical protein
LGVSSRIGRSMTPHDLAHSPLRGPDGWKLVRLADAR